MSQSPANSAARRGPWRWVPSLYFAEGLPYVVVMSVAVIMYKRLGISNTQIAWYTSWLYLPWVIKPFWSPLVEINKTRRGWILLTQLLIGGGLAGVALTLPADDFLRYTLAFLWLLAFSSATHDVAADGFYMLGLSDHLQAWFVGIRSTFYRLAMITGQGLLVMLAGALESSTGLPDTTVHVAAVEQVAGELSFAPQSSLPAPGGSTEQAQQRILTPRERIELPISPRSATEVDRLVQEVRQWNVSHQFYEPPEQKETQEQESESWFSSLKTQLEDWLTRNFGPEQEAADPTKPAGNVAVIYLRISPPLEEQKPIAVQVGRMKGDANFSVIEGNRFQVTADNADQPFASLVQIDTKLDHPSEATFIIRSGNSPLAWSITFYVLAGFFLMICLYHSFALPRPAADISHSGSTGSLAKDFLIPLASFFSTPRTVVVIAFLLLYRFAEAQLSAIAPPFLLDMREAGGLAMTTSDVGFVYGTVGVLMLVCGGLLGGFAAATHGLKYWLWWMVLAINLPNAAYLFLSHYRPESLWIVNLAVGVEQFGYGFGFTAYLLFMLYVSQGEHQTVHYALCTGLMALGMALPRAFSGWLQEIIGYQHFFAWVMLATIPSFLVCLLLPIDPQFGKRSAEEAADT